MTKIQSRVVRKKAGKEWVKKMYSLHNILSKVIGIY
jgi:hypothetical protein